MYYIPPPPPPPPLYLAQHAKPLKKIHVFPKYLPHRFPAQIFFGDI
jgi:hypothetical protein